MKKMKYDATLKEVILTEDEAKAIKAYIKGFQEGATRCSSVGEGWKAFLALDMASYVEGAPDNLTSIEIFNLIRAAAQKQGVSL